MSLLFAQIEEKDRYQQPNKISGKKTVSSLRTPNKNPYPQYGADGSKQENKFWNTVPFKFPTNGGPIQKLNMYGGLVNGYQPSIIRPIDSIQVPEDLNRGVLGEEKCNWPCYAGSNFQEWCSEDNAINYHAMRPLVQPDTYNKWLAKLFHVVASPYNKKPEVDDNVWAAVFCENTKKDIMNFIMLKVAEGVVVIPEMHKNGSWGSEQFYWTDATMYNFANRSGNYYRILFNLYNPLRSVGTEVETVVHIKPEGSKQPLVITWMNFVNQLEWKTNGQKVDQISGYNVSRAGTNPQVNLETEVEGPVPTALGWNYGNTLIQKEFNSFGFYENGENVKIEAGVPDSLKTRIKKFEQSSPSYLLGCATSKFTGTQGVRNNFEERKLAQKNAPINGNPRSVYDNPSIIYGVYPEKGKRYPKTSATGFART